MSKFRHEYKYSINLSQAEILRERAAAVMLPDSHADAGGGYHVRSLYFDTPYDDCCFENESGVDNRHKYRIRVYGQDSPVISLEIKSKLYGMTLKESCRITREEFEALISDLPLFPSGQQPDALRKFLIARERFVLRPKVIVDYDRIPFVYPDGNVRMTLDMNLCSSNHTELFFEKHTDARPVLSEGQELMELKFDEFIPGFLLNALSLSGLRRTSFSKYYLCRKFNLDGRDIYDF